MTLVFMSASIPGDFAYVDDHSASGRSRSASCSRCGRSGMIVASTTFAPRVPVAAVAIVDALAAAVQGLAKFVAPFWMLYAVPGRV